MFLPTAISRLWAGSALPPPCALLLRSQRRGTRAALESSRGCTPTMRVWEGHALIDMPAAEFWALRLDTNFDRFCAAAENCAFNLVSLSHGKDERGEATVTSESEVTAEESPLPSALQAMLGARRFAFVSRSSWHPGAYDRAHAASFTSSPRTMSQRVAVRGRTWLEPLTASTCRACYRVEIEVKVMAVSSVIEQGLEKRVADSYGRLAGLTSEYQATEACRVFLRNRTPAQWVPPPPPLTLDAPAQPFVSNGGSTPIAPPSPQSPPRSRSMVAAASLPPQSPQSPQRPSAAVAAAMDAAAAAASPVSPRARFGGPSSPNSRPPAWRLQTQTAAGQTAGRGPPASASAAAGRASASVDGAAANAPAVAAAGGPTSSDRGSDRRLPHSSAHATAHDSAHDASSARGRGGGTRSGAPPPPNGPVSHTPDPHVACGYMAGGRSAPDGARGHERLLEPSAAREAAMAGLTTRSSPSSSAAVPRQKHRRSSASANGDSGGGGGGGGSSSVRDSGSRGSRVRGDSSLEQAAGSRQQGERRVSRGDSSLGQPPPPAPPPQSRSTDEPTGQLSQLSPKPTPKPDPHPSLLTRHTRPHPHPHPHPQPINPQPSPQPSPTLPLTSEQVG